MYYVLRIAGAANIILADFNLAVSISTAKPPNLNPCQILRLYGMSNLCQFMLPALDDRILLQLFFCSNSC